MGLMESPRDLSESPRDYARYAAEYWQLVVPRKRHFVPYEGDVWISSLWIVQETYRGRTMPPIRCGHEKVIFNRDVDLSWWVRLARPSTSKKINSLSRDETQASGEQASGYSSTQQQRCQRRMKNLSHIERLPPELLAMLINHEDISKPDLIALALASDIFMPTIVRHVIQQGQITAAVWAGQELACIGNYLIDLPPAFEKDGLFHSALYSTDPDGKGDRGPIVATETCLARAINREVGGQYESPPDTADSQWRAAFRDFTMLQMSDIDKDRFVQLEIAVFETLFTRNWSSSAAASFEGSRWRLRNLMTKQFVRCRPNIPSLGAPVVGHVDHEALEGDSLRVDDVLLMYISWTNVIPEDPDDELKIDRGPWAGHCFDIVPELEDDKLIDGWKDVTDQVVSEAAWLRGETKRRPTGAMRLSRMP